MLEQPPPRPVHHHDVPVTGISTGDQLHESERPKTGGGSVPASAVSRMMAPWTALLIIHLMRNTSGVALRTLSRTLTKLSRAAFSTHSTIRPQASECNLYGAHTELYQAIFVLLHVRVRGCFFSSRVKLGSTPSGPASFSLFSCQLVFVLVFFETTRRLNPGHLPSHQYGTSQLSPTVLWRPR